MRTKAQLAWDLSSVLYLLDCAAGVAKATDNLKVQKLTFLHEFSAQGEGLATGHYKFFRYQFGPYSKVLAKDVELLEGLGFITKTSRRLTKRGQFLLESMLGEMSESSSGKRAIELIRGTALKFGPVPSSRLVDMVYSMTVPVCDLGGTVTKIRDVEMFLDILDPLHSGAADPATFKTDTLELFEQELAIRPEDLEPSSKAYQAAVSTALERMRAALG